MNGARLLSDGAFPLFPVDIEAKGSCIGEFAVDMLAFFVAVALPSVGLVFRFLDFA